MGTSPSNTLDLSVSDPAGHEYSVKFNGESFASGKHRKCYIATLSNEKAPKHNKKVVLKVFKPEFVNKYAFDYECVKDLERSITCRELSIKFNKTMEEYQSDGESIPISFPAPLRINIKRGKELTDKLISKVFNNIPIQIKSHKYLTVQLSLKNTQQYNYEKISSNNGWFDKTNHNYQFLSALPTFGGQENESEFQPFIRRPPEFKFWYVCVIISMFMTLLSIFDIPVFWPILLLYFIILFTITMKRQIEHMIKHSYIPCDCFKIKKKKKVVPVMPKVRPPIRSMPYSGIKKVNRLNYDALNIIHSNNYTH